ncbi:unnamed protein product [Caenorhabditis sp. 36 PRJEB53466]|nr:unnamed protein product [Caenorhabditis sp. 36 PRJEB53466]
MMTKLQVNSSEKSGASKTRKEKSCEKEHRRTQNINGAFANLQQHIPYLRPEERRQLPKIKTLRLAMQYIDHLNKLLSGNEVMETDCEETRPLTHSDFRQAICSEMRVKNSYRERAHSQELDAATVQRILAREEQRTRRLHVNSTDNEDFSPRPLGPHSNSCVNSSQIPSNQYMTFGTPVYSNVPGNSTIYSQSPESQPMYPDSSPQSVENYSHYIPTNFFPHPFH